jgi:hypothetical protein
MSLLTTRSARFFLLLLHLVGVTTHLRPTKSIWNDANTTIASSAGTRTTASAVGIRGVHTTSLPLERTDPSWINNQRLYDDDENDDGDVVDLYEQPHWLQDGLDQKCLGPMSTFGECGDASLWRIIPKSRRQSTKRQWIRWAIEEEDYDDGNSRRRRSSSSRHDGGDENDGPLRFALQLVDVVVSAATNEQNETEGTETQGTPGRRRDVVVDEQTLFITECLSRRRKDDQLVVVSCDQDRAWYWQINEAGILHFEKATKGSSNNGKSRSDKRRILLQKRPTNTLTCLGRNGTDAILRPCDGSPDSSSLNDETTPKTSARPKSSSHDENLGRVAPIRLVRQATESEFVMTSASYTQKKVVDTMHLQGMSPPNKDSSGKGPTTEVPPSPSGGGIPSHVDRVHAASTGKLDHTEILSSTRLSSLLSLSRSSVKVAKQIPQFLGDTNPILLSSTVLPLDNLSKATGSPKAGVKRQNPPSDAPSASRPVVHDNHASPSSKPIVRKIEFNPYIAASKNERWTDPQTGLVYPTDLCRYLGHDRKEAGRHTLTGVGQYTKTMLKIKVYGVAYYVSKRDVLADPSFDHFASHSAEELRQNAEFYQILRQMKSSSPNDHTKGPAGRFDRTLFIKTNMQLATDTMRSSLDADWKLLTPDDKALLIGSSMKERPVDDRMLEIIESTDNPSRCSCAQIAPPEYNADPSCCARGTELVFTWRKSGDLEVRTAKF